MTTDTGTIVAAIIAGTLTISAGLLANFYVRFSENRMRRREEVRQIVDNISKEIDNIKMIIMKLTMDGNKFIGDISITFQKGAIFPWNKHTTKLRFPYELIHDTTIGINTHLNEIDRLIHVSTPALEGALFRYRDEIEDIHAKALSFIGEGKTKELYTSVNKTDVASRELYSELYKIIKKRKYFSIAPSGKRKKN